MIAGVLLAAGRSARMGQPKLLLPWQGVPLVRHMAALALATELDELVVVTGYRAEHVRAALDGLTLRTIHNDDFLDGQSTSLRAGIQALPESAEAVVVMLADQPLLQPATVDQLIRTFRATGAPLVVPRHAGARGNPVLIARPLFGAVLEIQGDRGARDLLAANAEQIAFVDVADEGILLDVDTPEHFAAAVERLPSESRT